MRSLAGKTLFVTGGSRGIGLSIAVRAGKDGANVIIAAKTAEPNPKLPGTIFDAANEIEKAGGKALAVQCDIRYLDQIEAAVNKGVARFGGIDILINNASAINLAGTLDLPVKTYDLMHGINTRGTYMTSRACLPYLLKSSNPHVLNISPPLSMNPKWFKNHTAYTMAKYGMSMCVLGMSAEFQDKGVAFNALWPKTTIATAAVKNLLGGDSMIDRSRTPDIMADAAWAILTRNAKNCTGHFFVDEDVLIEEGVKEFDKYAVNPKYKNDLVLDFFLDSFDNKQAPTTWGKMGAKL